MMASAPSAHRVLEHFLATLDIGVTHITRCDIRDGWSVRFDACETASLHYCLDGCGTLDAGNGHRIALQPHSFVLMPPGVSYRLESAFESPTMSVDRARLGSWSARETAPTVKVGEAAAGVEMACGELRFATSTEIGRAHV